MIVLPVDTAVEISIGPAIDSGDFLTREAGIAYDAAGMSVSLIQEAVTGGVTAQAITPTTSGDNDWLHVAKGYYSLELTAAQNDTLGGLFAAVDVNGVLPMESPRYLVVPVTIHNALLLGSPLLTVNANPATVILGPVQQVAAMANTIAVPTVWTMFQHSAKSFVVTIVDDDGDAVDIDSMTLRLVVINTAKPTAEMFSINDAAITISGAGNNVATIPIGAPDSDTAYDDLIWQLRNITAPAAHDVLAWGTLAIVTGDKGE